jgi:hypothetical protein
MNDFCFFQTGKNGKNTTRFNGRNLKHQDSTKHDTINGISEVFLTGSKKRGPIANCRIIRPRSVPIGVNAAPEQQLLIGLTLMPNAYQDKKVARVFPNIRYKTTHHKSDALFSVGFISAPVHHTGVVWLKTASAPWFSMERLLGNNCILFVLITMASAAFVAAARAMPLMLGN